MRGGIFCNKDTIPDFIGELILTPKLMCDIITSNKEVYL